MKAVDFRLTSFGFLKYSAAQPILFKFTAKLFLVISIMKGDRHVYTKNRIRLAIDCKSSGFSI